MSTVVRDSEYKDIRPVPILIAFVVAGFVGLFSETALNMALGNLMVELDVISSTVQWITTGYLLTMGIVIPVSALLIQWFSTRQLFVASLPSVFHCWRHRLGGGTHLRGLAARPNYSSNRHGFVNPLNVPHCADYFPD